MLLSYYSNIDGQDIRIVTVNLLNKEKLNE